MRGAACGRYRPVAPVAAVVLVSGRALRVNARARRHWSAPWWCWRRSARASATWPGGRSAGSRHAPAAPPRPAGRHHAELCPRVVARGRGPGRPVRVRSPAGTAAHRRDVPVRWDSALSGVPGWFSTGRAVLVGVLARLETRRCPVGRGRGRCRLDTHPLVTGAVLGFLALAVQARRWPRWQRWRYVRARDPPGLPPAVPVPRHRPRPTSPTAGWTSRARFTATPNARSRWPTRPPEPRRRPQTTTMESSAGTWAATWSLSFGAYQATWTHPPARPNARPVRRVRPARPPDPPGYPRRRWKVDRGPARRGTAPVHRGRHRRRQDRHRVRPGRARPRPRLAGRHHRPQAPVLHRAAKPGRTC